MAKCNCYDKRADIFYTYDQFTGRPIKNEREIGICNGTKERDACDCNGDESKCDFYPYKRR